MSQILLSPGTVHILPSDIKSMLLSTKGTRTVWEDITSLARNEWICWIISAKKQATREKRIRVAKEQLLSGKRRPCCWPGCPHRKKKK